MSVATYPVKVDASLDSRLSRWLWLVKWVLAIPHYLVLAVLWLAFAVLSVAAFFAILFTGRYPRSIFEFNVGVLRWTWRVQYYAYGALGTDQYPPFTLRDDPAYPARLEVDYPERLSRGLVLVKWWLLAIPHYIIVALLVGGGTFATEHAGRQVGTSWPGLIGVLVVVAAVVLAVTGSYPRQIFDLVLGLNRWVLRVAAYAGLMTDQYPPFRLDMGGHEPGAVITLSRPAGVDLTKPSGPAAPERGQGWTAGRVISMIVGTVLALFAVGQLAGGAAVLIGSEASMVNGYVTSPAATYSTSGYALTTERIVLQGSGWHWVRTSLIGQVRARVTAADPATAVFVGIAPASAVRHYLADVRYTTVSDPTSAVAARTHQGTAAPVPPARQSFWAVHASGTGTQQLTWNAPAGNWVIVVMRADASPGLTVRADIGATLPGLPWIGGGLIVSGLIFGIAGGLMIGLAARRASR